VLLPLSFLFSLVLVGEGVTQTLAGSTSVHTLQGAREQLLSLGPVASQEAIKLLGTNGGGFFNANSAHPFENPTALTNFLEMLSILLIPAASCLMFGKMVKDGRQGLVLLAAMTVLFVPLTIGAIVAEQAGTPVLHSLGADLHATALQAGGNMEGKEVRFGITGSGLFASVTTAASCGAVNAMHDSFTPLGGLVPMWFMQLGEIVFGGVGAGLYGVLMYVVIAVFIAGLMVGRTPEYLGKKIEAYEMKMASLVILIPVATILVGAAIAAVLPAGTSPLGNPGAHGFSEILYAFTSGTANNGSAFGGLTASGTFYAIAIGLVMLIGRFLVIAPVLAIASSLAKKKVVPMTAGTLPTHTPLFVGLVVGTIVLVGALTFIPALALGPIVEHLQLLGH
jgi:K+-transporting ATPase ATPase A chain